MIFITSFTAIPVETMIDKNVAEGKTAEAMSTHSQG